MVRSSPAVSTPAKTILASRSTWRRLWFSGKGADIVEVPIATLGVSMPPIQHQYIELMASKAPTALCYFAYQCSKCPPTPTHIRFFLPADKHPGSLSIQGDHEFHLDLACSSLQDQPSLRSQLLCHQLPMGLRAYLLQRDLSFKRE